MKKNTIIMSLSVLFVQVLAFAQNQIPQTNQIPISTQTAAQVKDKKYLQLKDKFDAKLLKSISDLEKEYSYISSLPTEKKLEILDSAAESLAKVALDNRYLYNSSNSKLYYVIYEILKSKFNLPAKMISDASVVKNMQGELSFVIYSTEPFQGCTEMFETGLFYSSKPLALDASSPVFKYTHSWQTDSKKEFTAELVLKKIAQPHNLITQKQSPDYQRMTQSGFYNGFIIGDQSNAIYSEIKPGITDTEAMLPRYIEYLKKYNFVFESKNPSNIQTLPLINDFAAYLKARVLDKKNPIHFLMKDGHSGGEDKFIFRLTKKARILRASLKLADGKVENFEYVFPDFSNQKSFREYQSISNHEFGSWIKEREASSGLELVYLSGSCNSVDKALYELPAAQTKNKLLITLPSDINVVAFGANDFSATQILFTAIRQQDTFSKMRVRLNAVKKSYVDLYSSHYKRVWENVNKSIYVLPNEPEYAQKVLSRAIDVDIKVYEIVDGQKVLVKIIDK